MIGVRRIEVEQIVVPPAGAAAAVAQDVDARAHASEVKNDGGGRGEIITFW